jgi:hypothetical protein
MSILENLQMIYGRDTSNETSRGPATQLQIAKIIQISHGMLTDQELRALKDAEFEMLYGDNVPAGRYSYLCPKRNGRQH